MKLPSDLAFDRALGAQSLRYFLELAWPQVEPARRFMANYHHDAICEHLEAVFRREILRLIINVPPGTTKSLITSVMWPAWAWINEPGTKWITASYSGRISRRDSLRARHLLESRWYQERWGHNWKADPDNWSSMEYRNNYGGFRYATTVAGGTTGEHGDHQVVDDPIKPLDARGDRVDSASLSICAHWWDETMATRLVDPATSTRTIIMQRLHDRDLSGHCLDSGDYVHLNLPMRWEPRCVIRMPHPCTLKEDGAGDPTPPTPLGFKDPRTDGELLWEERYPVDVLGKRLKELGARGVAAQDQQRPVPAGGGTFKRDWVQFWQKFPKGQGVEFLQSWDCAFKGLSDSDYVVGQVWARKEGEYFLIDQVRDQMNFTATIQAILTLSAKWPRAIRKLIEDKANGPAVITHLQRRLPGLLPVNPQGGKAARANSVAPMWESGNVYIPDPSRAPWVHDFIEELVTFTGESGRPDDQVDGMTQALVHYNQRTVEVYRNAMRNVR
jgi:predicted phage terminase large subunit-like protein